MTNEYTYVDSLVERAKKAQEVAAKYTQEEVRRIAKAIGWLALNKAREWSEFGYEETKMGDVESKLAQTAAGFLGKQMES